MSEVSYKVAELFESINGEGTRAGELATFLRLAECNLNCSYCDTRWACTKDAPGENMTIDQILRKIEEFGAANVTVTGGEPLLHPEVKELLDAICKSGRRVEIETNGSIDIQPFRTACEDLVFTLDYKLPGSGMEEAMQTSNYACLKPEDTVKFVVSGKEDLERAYIVSETHDLTKRCHVYLSPVFGSIDPADIVAFMKERNWNDARLQIQLHKVIWDPMKRGV